MSRLSFAPLRRFATHRSGGTAIEHAVIAAMIALLLAATAHALQPVVTAALSQIGEAFSVNQETEMRGQEGPGTGTGRNGGPA